MKLFAIVLAIPAILAAPAPEAQVAAKQVKACACANEAGVTRASGYCQYIAGSVVKIDGQDFVSIFPQTQLHLSSGYSQGSVRHSLLMQPYAVLPCRHMVGVHGHSLYSGLLPGLFPRLPQARVQDGHGLPYNWGLSGYLLNLLVWVGADTGLWSNDAGMHRPFD